MIQSIRLKNFMSWEEIELDLSPGINVICGVSDKGKSVFINAIEWVRTGRPLGFEFASDWIKKENKNGDLVLEGLCEVSIKLTEGIEITRAIGKGVNEYRISTLNDPLRAFNKQVPDEVTNVLNLSDINIQNQDNPYFIFAQSAPEIGRQLNQIASLSDIDTAFKNADSSIRALNSSIKQDETILEVAIKEAEDFSWLDNAEEQLIKVEKISGQLSAVRNEEHTLRMTQTKLVELNKKVNQFKSIDTIQKNINELTKKDKIIKDEQKEYNRLIDIEEKIIDINSKLIDSNLFDGVEKRIKGLINLQSDIIKIEKDNEVLIDMEERILQLEKEFTSVSIEYGKINTKYNKMIPDKCPLCENDWRKNEN